MTRKALWQKLLMEINAADTKVHFLGSNTYREESQGNDMMVGEGLVNDHMGAAGREGGTCGVPCSPATLILSGDLSKRRTSCHSPHSFDVLTTSESRLVFVHNEDWWLCW